MPQHIVVVGGGSAGHVIPAIPVMQQLLTSGVRITFVGTTSGLEQGLMDEDVRRQDTYTNSMTFIEMLPFLCFLGCELGSDRPMLLEMIHDRGEANLIKFT